MIFYLDTSCIAKLFIQEVDSERLRRVITESDAVSSSDLSCVEMHSMIERRRREKLLSAREAKRISEVFQADWAHFGKIPVDEPVLQKARKLLAKHPLRTLDALQLASALRLQDHLEEPIGFLSADERLVAAAHRERLRTDY